MTIQELISKQDRKKLIKAVNSTLAESGGMRMATPTDIAHRFEREHVEKKANQDGVLFLETPFPEINQLIKSTAGQGLKTGNHHVLSGKSGDGKSKLTMNIVVHLLKQGHDVLWINQDQGTEDLLMDLACILSGHMEEELKWLPGGNPQYDQSKVDDLKRELDELDAVFHYNDDQFDSLQAVKDICMIYAYDGDLEDVPALDDIDMTGFGVDFIVFDTLQQLPGNWRETHEKTMKATSMIRSIANNFNVATWAISQYTSSGARQNTSVNFNEQRGGSSIVNTADFGIAFAPDSDVDDGIWTYHKLNHGASELTIKKNRRGDSGVSVAIEWDFDCMRAVSHQKKLTGLKDCIRNEHTKMISAKLKSQGGQRQAPQNDDETEQGDI